MTNTMTWWSMWKGVTWHHALKSPFLPSNRAAQSVVDSDSDSEEDIPTHDTVIDDNEEEWFDDGDLEDVDVQMMEWELDSDAEDADEIETLLVSLHVYDSVE